MAEKQIIKCEFNLFNEGRTYTGNHRKYVLENARAVAQDPATTERIKLREALGYYGHQRRVLAGKLNIGEVETVKLPNGATIIVNNVPSNVTVALDVRDDGTVYHEQEVLDTETGRIVSALNASRVGGFSWACPADDGGRLRPTRLKGFMGMDYVKNPNFSANRGYVLEDSGDVTEDMVMEAVAKVLGDDAKAQGYMQTWQADAYLEAMRLRDELEASEAAEAELLASVDALQAREQEFEALDATAKQAVLDQEKAKANTKALMDFIVTSAPFFIPEDVQHAMMEGDFEKVRGVLEAAKRIDFSQYPVGGPRGKAPGKPLDAPKAEKPEYGSAGWAWTL